jgi:hypothetical protein
MGASFDNYVMESLEGCSGTVPNVPRKIPVPMSSADLTKGIGFSLLSPMRFCDKYLTQSWLNYGDIYLALSEVSNIPDGYIPGVTAKLWSLRDSESSVYIQKFDLCPASGRLCVMTNGQEIRVMDYLIPI